MEGPTMRRVIKQQKKKLSGHIHEDRKGRKVDVRTIDKTYAQNLYCWYLDRANLFGMNRWEMAGTTLLNYLYMNASGRIRERELSSSETNLSENSFDNPEEDTMEENIMEENIMNVWAIFSIDNEYNQLDNNLNKLYKNKPTIIQLSNYFFDTEDIGSLEENLILFLSSLLKGEEKGFQHVNYRLEQVEVE